VVAHQLDRRTTAGAGRRWSRDFVGPWTGGTFLASAASMRGRSSAGMRLPSASSFARMRDHHHARSAGESGQSVAAYRHWPPLREVVVSADGSGRTLYARRPGPGEVDAWAVSAFAGIEAEIDERRD
jgi:hypothetical protein